MTDIHVNTPVTDTDELVLQYSSESFTEHRKELVNKCERFYKVNTYLDQIKDQDKVDYTTACEIFTMLEMDYATNKAKMTSAPSIINKDIVSTLLSDDIKTDNQNEVIDELNVISHQVEHYKEMTIEVRNYLHAFLGIIDGLNITNDFSDVILLGRDKEVHVNYKVPLDEIYNGLKEDDYNGILEGDIKSAFTILSQIYWACDNEDFSFKIRNCPDIRQESLIDIIYKIKDTMKELDRFIEDLVGYRDTLSKVHFNSSITDISLAILNWEKDLNYYGIKNIVELHRTIHKRPNIFDTLIDYTKAIVTLSKDNAKPFTYKSKFRSSPSEGCAVSSVNENLINTNKTWDEDSILGKFSIDELKKSI